MGGRVIEAHYLAGVAEAEERNGGFDPQTVASVPFESYLGFMYTVCVWVPWCERHNLNRRE